MPRATKIGAMVSDAASKTKKSRKRKKSKSKKDAEAYEVTGAARLPGSKYPITEAEINDAEDQRAFEEIMDEAKGRARGGCCKEGMIARWHYIEEYNDEFKKELREVMNFADHPFSKELTFDQLKMDVPDGGSGAEGVLMANLAKFLGEAPRDRFDPPNPNAFVYSSSNGMDRDENLFRFNRKKLIVEIYSKDRPTFGTRIKEQKVKTVQVPSSNQIKTWERKRLIVECRKRGYNRPPFNFKVAPSGYATITSSGVKSHGSDVPAEFKKGLPKVKKCTDEQLRLLLKFISEDPRYKHGQPIIQPAYFDRVCQNIPCCLLFWLYWIGMLVVAGLAYVSGDPLRLVRPTDYNGHTCGDTAHLDTANKTWLFFPQLAEDSLQMMQLGNVNCAQTYAGCFYGVCMHGCPNVGDVVCNYETEAAIAAGGLSVSEQLRRRKILANIPNIPGIGKPSTQKCWYVGIEQTDIAFRCFPFTRKKVTTEYTCVTMQASIAGSVAPTAAITTSPTTTVASTGRPTASPTGNWFESGSWSGAPTAAPTTMPTTLAPTTGSPTALAIVGDGAINTVRTKIVTVGKNSDQIDILLAQCSGTIESTTIEEATYQSGTSALSGMLNGFLAFTEQIFSDISNSIYALIVIGPLLAGILAFLFINLMMYLAGLLIWTIILACQLFTVAITTVFFYKAGHLQFINDYIAGSNSSKLQEYTSKMASFANQYSRDSGPGGGTGNQAGNYASMTEDAEWYWGVGGYVCAVLALVTIVLPCLLRSQIKLCIALVKEAARSVRRTKSVLLYPFFGYFWIFVIFVWFLLVSTYIISSTLTKDDLASLGDSLKAAIDDRKASNSSQTNENFARSIQQSFQNSISHVKSSAVNQTYSKVDFSSATGNVAIRAMFLVHFFGWIWTMEFIKAVGSITISGAVALDYWVDMSEKKFRPSFPVGSAFWRTMRYHVGTACFGSLIIAIVQMIRYIMMYVDSKTAELQKNSKIVKILMMVVHVCLWCFEKCLRFITTNAYILTAIEGTGFCTSAWRSFKLIFSNSLRIATTQSMSSLLLFLAQLGISLFCTILMWVTCKYAPQFQPDGKYWVDSPLAPCFLVFISSMFVAYTFMNVYQMAILTLLMSFCLDEDKFKKGLYKNKTDARGLLDRRMYCMVNNKLGLIKLVSKSAREELLKANEERARAKQADLMGDTLLAKPAAEPAHAHASEEEEEEEEVVAPMRGGGRQANPASQTSKSGKRFSTPPRRSRQAQP